MIRSVPNSQSNRGEPRPAAQIASVSGMPASRRGSTIIVAVGVLAVLRSWRCRTPSSCATSVAAGSRTRPA